eukprot:TRINITY_DN3315_c0_g1_i3.p1 TRINITY_DN3315_c0_g1~~TRINITY_DN3315_c0_g1_i3.p1  ORF type:complete len:470 (+),score=74.98 TRINITY_DN3315_c0_g1_i3:43-1452(+)
MSEDKLNIPKSVLAGQRIHYGVAQVRESKAPANTTPIASAPTTAAYHPLSESSQEARRRHQQILDEFERRARARGLVVPTNDDQVKARLRQLGEPICLFGERAPDRRDRLRDVLVRRDITELPPLPEDVAKKAEQDAVVTEKKEVFYTHGSKALKNARLWIANYSVPKAKDRIEDQKRQRTSQPNAEIAYEIQVREFHQKLKAASNQSSQYGDDRPLSCCSFSPNSEKLLIGSWSSYVKLWSVSSVSCENTYKGHTGRVTDVSFHPSSFLSASPTALNFVSSGSEGVVHMWSLDSTSPIHTLKGHFDRVTSVAFHPSGRFIASASGDTTVRLWDAETRNQLLIQEGHSRTVQVVCMHPDGSLMFSGGDDCAGRLWDLRTGRCIRLLEGHIKPIYGADFSCDGYHLATSGDDNFIRIWDLRKKENNMQIPGHTSLITSVRYEPTHGRYLASCSVDTTCRLWSTLDGSPLK